MIITEYAPNSIKENILKDYNGKVIVLDASYIIYQYVY